MPEFLRVSEEIDGKRREYTIPAVSFDPAAHKVVDRPALNTDGTQVPPKYAPQSLSSKGQKATTPKENES